MINKCDIAMMGEVNTISQKTQSPHTHPENKIKEESITEKREKDSSSEIKNS